ncbi:hypothetical protein KFE25_002511 [Diacronema lutheri]|uniref:5'-nucleotidase n=1 Tax=Diacronema lutheri TaxID=2081491 RepID=A0A8J5X8B9_DIALT|nr:hypothetical protein KFE25_002511 [Diacronema lutheri]
MKGARRRAALGAVAGVLALAFACVESARPSARAARVPPSPLLASRLVSRAAPPRAAARLEAAGDSAAHLRVVRDDASVDVFGQSTWGDLDHEGQAEVLSADEVEALLQRVLPAFPTLPTGESTLPLDTATRGDRGHEPRGVYCSRTLNLRSIKCIGYDMDYTLVQYNFQEWEAAAYTYAKQALAKLGFPVDALEFTDDLVVRGCIVDKRLGNLVLVDRFGYVRRAMHGTRRLSRTEMHDAYGRLTVDLRQTARWEFLNTLFSISEGCLYAQLVDKLDDASLFAEARPPFTESRCQSYEQLHNACSRALFHAHVNSALKADVLAEPDRFVCRDPSLPLTLLDQQAAGKKLVLITNSDWVYTEAIMRHICSADMLPGQMTWRDLFDVVIVSARKPAFFSESSPLYEIVDEASGMMLQRYELRPGRVYCGGHARLVERLFECEKDELLYVGDHIYTDVNMVKATMRWRTALVVQELESEVAGLTAGKASRDRLQLLLRHKDILSNVLNHMRTEMVRYEQGRPSALFADHTAAELRIAIARVLATMAQLDRQITPLIEDEGAHVNRFWGYMSRAGFADKSHLMRQIEKYADIYMSRVSNMLKYTPYMYYRNSIQSLAHDQLTVDDPSTDDMIIAAASELAREKEAVGLRARASSDALA